MVLRVRTSVRTVFAWHHVRGRRFGKLGSWEAGKLGRLRDWGCMVWGCLGRAEGAGLWGVLPRQRRAGAVGAVQVESRRRRAAYI